MKAIQLLRENIIGDVLVAKAWNVQRRRDIGRAKPSAPPPHVDYDMWVGPAPLVPFQSNRFHYDWHWWYDFGTGDIGNDGTHEIDIARWGLGVEGFPSRVSSLGGKYFFDDDQQFPDTATCLWEWTGLPGKRPRKQMIFEMRLWSKSYPHHCDSGIEFHGTSGMLMVSKRGKLLVWDDNHRPITDLEPSQKPRPAVNHQVDFLEAIRGRREPAAGMPIALDSVACVHLANLSSRVGRSLSVTDDGRRVVDDAQATAWLGRTYRDGHWAVPHA
jgi:predicted dehydrogenase